MRNVLILAGLVVAGGITLLAFRDHEDDETTAWRTAEVERGELKVEVTATGTLQPVTQVQVGTQVTGNIQQLFADFNSRVTKGQIVAQIDPAQFKARVESDRANLERSKADVVRVQAVLGQAERDVVRNGALVADGLVTQQAWEAATADRDSLLAQVDVARASVLQQQAALTVSDVNLQYTTILSPIDGIVISRNVDVGQTVSASLSAPTIFVIAADLQSMQVQASVAEADIGRILNGQKVGFTVDAFQGETFEGAVSQVRLSPTTLQNVVTYTVLVDAPNPDERLLPGMTANLSFEIDHAEDVLLVPDTALRFEPPAEGKEQGESRGGWGGESRGGRSGGERSGGGQHAGAGPRGGDEAPAGTGHVHVLRDGKLERIDVQVGLSDGLRSAVSSPQLHEGDQVVTGVMPAQTASASSGSNPFMPQNRSGGGRPRM